MRFMPIRVVHRDEIHTDDDDINNRFSTANITGICMNLSSNSNYRIKIMVNDKKVLKCIIQNTCKLNQ